MNEESKKTIEYFDNFYKSCNIDDIKTDNWLWWFKEYIKKSNGPVVDLGCGLGNNVKYFLEEGMNVIPCDGSINAINKIKEKYPQIKQTACFDMLEPFPLLNGITDLVVADQSLHYFTKEDTINILKKIKKLLYPEGNLLVRVNTVNNIPKEKNLVEEVERNLFRTKDGRLKRYFDEKDLYEIFNVFDIKYVRKDKMERYDNIKETYQLRLKKYK